MNGSPCKVGGCGNPAVNYFCDRHNEAFQGSAEQARCEAIRLEYRARRDPGLACDDSRWRTTVCDFARRMEAEERNAPKEAAK